MFHTKAPIFHTTAEARRDNGRRRIACLAGDGVGPELMGEATRVLARLSALHALAIEEVHLPFAGEALTRYGHPLPAATRSAYREADAILVATPDEPAVEAVKADLELDWRVSRVHVPRRGDAFVFGSVASGPPELAVRRAFFSAASKRGRLTAVGSSPSWRETIEAERLRWDGLAVDYHTVGETLVTLREQDSELEVIVTEPELVEPIVDAVACLAGPQARVAHAWLAEAGPGLFIPGESTPSDLAGFGVADPTGMLLTLALLLSEGLHLRSGARTLERAIAVAKPSALDTRSFTDSVLRLLPEARTDVELFAEVWA